MKTYKSNLLGNMQYGHSDFMAVSVLMHDCGTELLKVLT
jgi:hypothetical protein